MDRTSGELERRFRLHVADYGQIYYFLTEAAHITD